MLNILFLLAVLTSVLSATTPLEYENSGLTCPASFSHLTKIYTVPNYSDYEPYNEYVSSKKATLILPTNYYELSKIIEDQNDPRFFDASEELLKYWEYTPRDKRLILNSMYEIAQNFDNQDAFKATKFLLDRDSNLCNDEKNTLESRICDMAQNNKLYSLHAAFYLLEYNFLTNQNNQKDSYKLEIAKQVIHKIAMDDNHPLQPEALFMFWLSMKDKKNLIKNKLPLFFKKINDETNIFELALLYRNYTPKFINKIQDIIFSPSFLYKIVRDQLYECLDFSKKQNFSMTVHAINKIASNSYWENSFDAAAFIIKNYTSQAPYFDINAAYRTMCFVADTHDHVNHRDALRILLNSSNPKHNTFAKYVRRKFLQQNLYPITIIRRQQFNLNTIGLRLQIIRLTSENQRETFSMEDNESTMLDPPSFETFLDLAFMRAICEVRENIYRRHRVISEDAELADFLYLNEFGLYEGDAENAKNKAEYFNAFCNYFYKVFSLKYIVNFLKNYIQEEKELDENHNVTDGIQSEDAPGLTIEEIPSSFLNQLDKQASFTIKIKKANNKKYPCFISFSRINLEKIKLSKIITTIYDKKISSSYSSQFDEIFSEKIRITEIHKYLKRRDLNLNINMFLNQNSKNLSDAGWIRLLMMTGHVNDCENTQRALTCLAENK